MFGFLPSVPSDLGLKDDADIIIPALEPLNELCDTFDVESAADYRSLYGDVFPFYDDNGFPDLDDPDVLITVRLPYDPRENAAYDKAYRQITEIIHKALCSPALIGRKIKVKIIKPKSFM